MTKQNNPLEKRLRANLEIKAFYTVKELMPILGFKSMNGARNFLMKLNVPMQLIGNKYILWLTDLQTYTPQLFASIQEVNNLKTLQQEMDDPVFKGQFEH